MILFFSSKFTGLLPVFPRKFYGAQNGSLTEEKDKAGSTKGINLGM